MSRFEDIIAKYVHASEVFVIKNEPLFCERLGAFYRTKDTAFLEHWFGFSKAAFEEQGIEGLMQKGTHLSVSTFYYTLAESAGDMLLSKQYGPSQEEKMMAECFGFNGVLERQEIRWELTMNQTLSDAQLVRHLCALRGPFGVRGVIGNPQERTYGDSHTDAQFAAIMVVLKEVTTTEFKRKELLKERQEKIEKYRKEDLHLGDFDVSIDF